LGTWDFQLHVHRLLGSRHSISFVNGNSPEPEGKEEGASLVSILGITLARNRLL
jgi:hypothetical protein